MEGGREGGKNSDKRCKKMRLYHSHKYFLERLMLLREPQPNTAATNMTTEQMKHQRCKSSALRLVLELLSRALLLVQTAEKCSS